MPIVLSQADLVQLEEAVLEATGTAPALYRHPEFAALAYIGPYSQMVAFELAVILTRRSGLAALEAGYLYGGSDVVEEMRYAMAEIATPRTQALGHQIVYYWPGVSVV